MPHERTQIYNEIMTEQQQLPCSGTFQQLEIINQKTNNFEGTLSKYIKNSPQISFGYLPYKLMQVIFAYLIIAFLFNFTFIQLLFCAFILIIFTFIFRVRRKSKLPFIRHYAQVILGIILLGGVGSFFQYFKGYEIPAEELQFQYQTPEFNEIFYRISYPRAFYERKVIQFLTKYNYQRTIQKSFQDEAHSLDQLTQQLFSFQIKNVQTHQMKSAWPSDPMRFDFILKYWEASENGGNTPNFMCLMESDFAVDVLYVMEKMQEWEREGGFSVMHVENNWREITFEKYNIGLLCTTKNASVWTRLWVRMMRWLHLKTYRRLLFNPLLFSMLPGRKVLKWGQDGCGQYKPQCKYIHFTLKKFQNIGRALKRVSQDLRRYKSDFGIQEDSRKIVREENRKEKKNINDNNDNNNKQRKSKQISQTLKNMQNMRKQLAERAQKKNIH